MHTTTHSHHYRKLSGTHIGPGGINDCPGCTKFSQPKRNRRLANRAVRHSARREIEEALLEAVYRG